jgi:hypothetical protein
MPGEPCFDVDQLRCTPSCGSTPPFDGFGRDVDPVLPRQAMPAITVLATFVVASLSYRFLESPILRSALRFR